MSLRMSAPRASARWTLLIAIVAGLVFALGGAALAVHDVGEFELDKNATNDLSVTKFGDLATSINSSTTTVNVCRTTPAPEPTLPFTILIRAERMSVTNAVDGTFGGNCSGTKRTYTVSRGFDGTTAAAQAKGGVDGIVSLLVAAPGQLGPDWDQVYTEWLADNDTKCEDLGLVECAFVEDGIGPTIFIGGGSKDYQPISAWQHTTGGSPDKAEILNAYAAKAVVEAGYAAGDQVLYFGMDRYAVDGSTDIGFWFFKSPVYFCPDATAPADACEGVADGHFAGEHQVGDILALATFTQGGAATNIRVFEWVGSGGNESGTIEGPTGLGQDCIQEDPALTLDEACGTVNDTTIEVPWEYTFKGAAVGGWVPAGGFFEGGINLTDAGLAGCFSSFLAETRSSPEITAILKDFALGQFESCATELTTTPADEAGSALVDSDGNGIPDIQIGTGDAGVDVTDSALLDVKGTSTWEGTLEFFLCGPFAAPIPDDPLTEEDDAVPGDLCDAGGVQIVDPARDPLEVSDQGGTTYVSGTANLTEVGYYCWRGEFISGTDVPDATDASEGECFEVLPVTPTLSTQAIGPPLSAPLSGPVSFGDPLYDQATLAGTANEPGDNGGDGDGNYLSINATNGEEADGTITFTLWQKDCLAEAEPAPNGEEVEVAGDGNYYSTGFTPDSPGEYTWVAVYSGSTSGNTLGTDHNTLCNEDDEDVTVQQLQPTLSTAQTFIPNDAVTVSVEAGAGDLAGSVTFYLWVDDPNCTPDDDDPETVGDGPDYTFGPFPVSDTDDAGDTTLSASASTDNTLISFDADHDFYWIVDFDSTTTAHLDINGACGNENSSIRIDNGAAEPLTP